MKTRTPQVIVGPDGVYLTGRFWPLRTFGQTFLGARLSESEPVDLLLTFRRQHGPNSFEGESAFPVPRQSLDEARVLVDVLNRDLGHEG